MKRLRSFFLPFVMCLIANFLVTAVFVTNVTPVHAQSLPGLSSNKNQTQQTPNIPEQLSAENIRALMSTLNDEQVRQLLLQRLDAVAKKQKAKKANDSPPMLDVIAGWGIGAFEVVSYFIVKTPEIPKNLGRIFSAFIDQRVEGVFTFLWKAAIGIFAGLAAWYFVFNSRLGAKIKRPTQESSLSEVLKILALRMSVELLALFALFIVSFLTLRFLLPKSDGVVIHMIMWYLVALPMIATAMSRFLMAPKWSEARLLPIDDRIAVLWHWATIAIAFLAGLSVFVIDFSILHGVALEDTVLVFWIDCTIFLVPIVMCIITRKAITELLLGTDNDASPMEQRVAAIFPWFSIFMIICTWLLVLVVISTERYDLLAGGRHFITLILVVFAPSLDTLVRGLVRHLVPPMTGEGPLAEKAYRDTKRSYIRIGRIIILGIILSLLDELWGIGIQDISKASPSLQFIDTIFEQFFIIAVGYLLWELATLWINRKMAAEHTASGFDLNSEEPGGGEGGGTGLSRLSTILPMVKLIVQCAIIAMTFLLAVGNMGIDITPLIAGAGVFGIAIGFGAQTLVKDIVSGIFFLIDDAFRVGEYLVIGDTVGTVEKLSVRSLQLRHHKGPVHIIPYGEIPKVTNNSRDWVIVKMRFTFPFDTDPNKIKKIFKRVGADILQADYASDIIQTFKSQGVYDVDDVGLVIRGKFMAKPGTQWVMKKDIYNRINTALDEAGIQFARKEVRVQIPGLESDSTLTEEQKKQIGAAASEAAQDKLPDGAAPA